MDKKYLIFITAITAIMGAAGLTYSPLFAIGGTMLGFACSTVVAIVCC